MDFQDNVSMITDNVLNISVTNPSENVTFLSY